MSSLIIKLYIREQIENEMNILLRKTKGVSMKKYMNSDRYYFAAANGYDGFRSCFDMVFSPRHFKKLYILKGGPGTGKSTLMKRIAENFSDSMRITRILCSSDTSSLDGIIIENGGIRVAIADGTSPHVIESQYPGAVEEIVNLGDGFNYRSLMMASSEIIELYEHKKVAYKRAYSALLTAGEIYKHIESVLLDIDIYKAAEMNIPNLDTKEYKAYSGEIREPFLLSSFSKDGLTHLPIQAEKKRIVYVGGDGVSEHITMGKIAKKISASSGTIHIYTSPLSTSVPDVIELDDTVYAISRGGNIDVNSTSFFEAVEGYSGLRNAYLDLLEESRRDFSAASAYHFALEDIYSKNVSFENNGGIEKRICDEITEIFDK